MPVWMIACVYGVQTVVTLSGQIDDASHVEQGASHDTVIVPALFEKLHRKLSRLARAHCYI